MQILYNAIATAPEGREGRTHAQDGQVAWTLTLPPPLGEDGPGTNPEELLAASIATCCTGALQAVASKRGIETGPVAVTAYVSLVHHDQGLDLEVRLEGRLPELEEGLATDLMKAAVGACPYAQAIQGNVAIHWALASMPISA